MNIEDRDRLSILLHDASKALDEAHEIVKANGLGRAERELFTALVYVAAVDARHLHSVAS